MKKVGKFFIGVIEVFIICYVIFITSCILCRNKYGYTQYGDITFVTIDNNNMVELNDYEKGDLVLVSAVNHNTVEPGEEVYYYDSVRETYVLRKGTIKEVVGDSYSAIYILNENNLSVSHEKMIGTPMKSYSKLGMILDLLESQLGFLLIVILPILILFIYQVYNMVILLKFDGKD